MCITAFDNCVVHSNKSCDLIKDVYTIDA